MTKQIKNIDEQIKNFLEQIKLEYQQVFSLALNYLTELKAITVKFIPKI